MIMIMIKTIINILFFLNENENENKNENENENKNKKIFNFMIIMTIQNNLR